jgi:N-acetylglucosamine kinase-like BadF-type ATPase
MARLALEGPEELVVWAGGASKADVAALVPVVQAEARAGDTVAADILRRAAEALEGQIEALLERLGPWRAVPRVALGGGLLEEGGALRTALIASLGSRGLEVVEGHPVAVRGAAGLARALGAEGGATS